ncbi:hypothetical protein FTUN_8268 [Frigoriglobus tundricola]|uniref:Uncharacterized protein n=1 Tax=Frigoriglobus tundricola TaxID=2774151 RepID=A0A6M5Z3F6_9BACT|nr:hypothetical protein FTUN_8268 [Frigoriglobus tundricola]
MSDRAVRRGPPANGPSLNTVVRRSVGSVGARSVAGARPRADGSGRRGPRPRIRGVRAGGRTARPAFDTAMQ